MSQNNDTPQSGLSDLSWRILSLFMEQTQRVFNGQWGRGYIAAWNLGEKLGGDATTIGAVTTKIAPRNAEERALRELLDLGLVEEMADLGERFRLVVRVGTVKE